MKLSKEIIQFGKKYRTPFLLFDLDIIRQKYQEIKKSIENVEVFYAIKANDEVTILKTLNGLGCGFEISSLSELRKLIKIGVEPAKIMCLNPIKSIEFLQEMRKIGVTVMAYDSLDEVDKIAKYAPGSEVVVRITVSNEGSDWPLTKKFGVDSMEALPLLKYAQSKGLKPIGITFHVGSQCRNVSNYVSALYVCDDIWNQAKEIGIHLSLISLGGGIPIQHLKKIPTIDEIGSSINIALQRNFQTVNGRAKVTIEPGRGMVGDAAIMVTSVVGKAKRDNEDWIYIDVGVFNGLMETIEGFEYEIQTEEHDADKKKTVTIAGPSCDSVDIPFKSVLLEEVALDDRVYIINAGAYTTVYAASFNGFDIPQMYFLNE